MSGFIYSCMVNSGFDGKDSDKDSDKDLCRVHRWEGS